MGNVLDLFFFEKGRDVPLLKEKQKTNRCETPLNNELRIMNWDIGLVNWIN